MMDKIPEIKEYLFKLPASARQVIVSADWHSRVSEISRKYSLGSEQTSNLEYEILFVLLGMESDTDFTENIQKQLNISGLLASQIDGEVNTRVFAYLLDLIQKKEIPSVPISNSKPILPEIAPDILPVIEKNVPRYIPNNLPGKIISEQRNQNFISLKDTSTNQILKPVNKPVVENNIIDNKLNNVVKGMTDLSVQAEKPEENKLPQKHNFDPYREPIN